MKRKFQLLFIFMCLISSVMAEELFFEGLYFEEYKVQKGDTLFELLRKRGYKPLEEKDLAMKVLSYNKLNLSSSKLMSIGRIVLIPIDKNSSTDKVSVKEAAISRFDSRSGKVLDLTNVDAQLILGGGTSDVHSEEANGDGIAITAYFEGRITRKKRTGLLLEWEKSLDTVDNFQTDIDSLRLAFTHNFLKDISEHELWTSIGIRRDQYDFTGVSIFGFEEVTNLAPMLDIRYVHNFNRRWSLSGQLQGFVGGESEVSNNNFGNDISLRPSFLTSLRGGYSFNKNFNVHLTTGFQYIEWNFESRDVTATLSSPFVRFGIGVNF